MKKPQYRKKITKNNRQLHILIIEAYTDANIGSCALVENTLKILRTKFPDSEIKVMAQYPKAFSDLYNVTGVDDIFCYPAKRSLYYKILWLIKTVLWMLFNLFELKLHKENVSDQNKLMIFQEPIVPFLWADIVVSVGAERLNDKYYKTVLFSLYSLYVSKYLGKKTIIFPSTFGPFFFWWSKLFAGKVLSQLDIIYTRDHASTQTICDNLNVPREKVISSVDVAVLQESIGKREALRMIPAEENELIVGISAMRWGYFKNRIETPYSNYDAYVRELAKTANTLISEYGVTIVFYPTNYRIHGCEDDDPSTAYNVLSMINYPKRVKVISRLPKPSQFQGMLSCSQINITTRMHACILSTNAYIPTISINYLFKLKEYMSSLGLSDFSIDIEEFCSEKALTAFRKMWPEREKWRIHLEKKIRARKHILWNTMERLNAHL